MMPDEFVEKPGIYPARHLTGEKVLEDKRLAFFGIHSHLGPEKDYKETVIYPDDHHKKHFKRTEGFSV